MNGNNRLQLGMQTAGKTGSPRFDFGGIKPKDYNYTGMQAVGDVAGQLLRVGKPFAEATKINRDIESHERDMANKERIRSFGVATRQLGGIIARANPTNATIFQELNKVSEVEEFIGGQLQVTDTGEMRKVDVEGVEKEHPIYTFNILDPKTGESINEIQATTAEAVNMFDGMLAPEMQRQVRKTAQTNTEARKRIRAVGNKIGEGKGNVFDMMAVGIPLTSEMQDTFNTFFAGSPKNQQEIMAQLISDTADENELKKKKEMAEEARKVAKEGREKKKSVVDIALTKARTEKAQKEVDGKAMTADKAREKLLAIAKFKSSLNKTGGWNETIFELMAQKDPEFAKRALSINSSKKEVNDTVKELEDYYRSFLPAKQQKGTGKGKDTKLDIEKQNAMDAIDQGISLENVQRMYKLRTGEELEL